MDNLKSLFPRDPWPHQLRGVWELLEKLKTSSAVCFAAPTGSGKTLMQSAIANLALANNRRVVIYNARKPLTAQLSRTLEEAGIHHGARAASMKDQQNLHAAMQVASLQTDFQRVLNQECWDIHDANLVIVDEAHMPEARGEKAQQLYQRYLSNGAKLVGFTGTPLELNHIYKDIVVCGTKAEMLQCKAHVLARTFAIHELDTSKIKPVKTGEFSEGDVRRECWNHAIVGYAYDDWLRLNPDAKPTMASAPGVEESMWVARTWMEKGHTVAHIDARECWVNGERQRGDKAREQVLEDARKGKFALITNCEVLTAGIDIPCLYHLILLRPFGKFSNYLQVVGRVIRYSEETPEHVIIQDHTGNLYRHGSANQDPDWETLFHETESSILKAREGRLKGDQEPEPIICANCGRAREGGNQCPSCGYISDKSTRRIVQLDGQLQEATGRVYKPDVIRQTKPLEQKQWDSIFYRARNSKGPYGMNFYQACQLYQKEFGSPPPNWLERIPADEINYSRRLKDLDWGDLT